MITKAFKRPADDGDTDAKKDVKKVKFVGGDRPQKNFQKRPGDDRPQRSFQKRPGGKFDGPQKFGKDKWSGKGGVQRNDRPFQKRPGGKFDGPNKFGKDKWTGKDGAQQNDQQKAPEKVDWNKYKEDRKNLKLQRKNKRTGKDLFELTTKAKQIYEELKCKATKDKDILATKLHNLLKGGTNYQRIVLAHDTARVVQCLLKAAPGDIKREISESLIPIIPQMALSKYAHFCVMRMVKYGTPDIKEKIISSIYGHVVKMATHAFSNSIIDTIYISWASAQQKANMRQEFYGEIYRTTKDKSVKCLKNAYEKTPELKKATLNSIKANLEHAANKKLVDNSLIHAILHEYLGECDEEDRNEIIALYSPFIPSLASTKEGTRSAIQCFWYSAVKDRRAILKVIKEHIETMCVHEHGHVFILAVLNSTDDTKGLKKAVIDKILECIKNIAENEWGRRVIEWLVVPDATSSFHPQIIKFLDEGLKFSKKDKVIRRTEIMESIVEPLCTAISTDADFWLSTGHIALTTAAILKACKGDHVKKAFDGLANVVCNPEWMVGEKKRDATLELAKKEKAKLKESQKGKRIIKNPMEEEKNSEEAEEIKLIFGVESAGIHMALKKIIKDDTERMKSNETVLFTSSLAEKLTDQVIEKWLPLNRPSFIIVIILENCTDDVKETIKNLLAPFKNTIESQSHPAAKFILNKLNC